MATYIDPNTFLLGFALFLIVALWIVSTIAKFRGKMNDFWRLRFKRSKVISVRFLMPSGAIDQRYLIPNERNWFELPHGMYHYDPRLAHRNTTYGIPEIDLVYQQVAPKEKELILDVQEIEIEEPAPDGTLVTIKKQVPTYIIKSSGVRPKLLQVPKQKNWKEIPAGKLDFVSETAQEVKELHSMDVARVAIQTTRSNANRQDLLFYIAIALVAICLIGFMVLYNDIKNLTNLVNHLQSSLQSSGISHG